MKSKKKFIKTIFLTMSMALMLSVPFTANAAQGDCTSWETYRTSYGNCTTSWCNPIWRPSGLKQNVTYSQSQVCDEGGGNYVLKTRTIDSTECNCD